MKTSALVALVASLLVLPARADAQQVHLQIQNGRVTLDAQNVLVRQILAEWSKVGGAKVINAEKITGGPVTLQLSGVSERQALDTILRNVAGYMLATRQAGTTGASGFDRILILPTSTAPRNAAAAPAPGFGTVGGGRAMPPPPQPADPINADPDPEEDQPQDEPDQDADVGPAIGPGAMRDRMQRMQQLQQMRQGGMNPMGQPAVPFPQSPGGVQPFPGQAPMGMPVQGGANVNMPQGYPMQQTPPSPVTTTPSNPFGIPAGATSMPGVVTPVPETPTSASGRPMTRPPR